MIDSNDLPCRVTLETERYYRDRIIDQNTRQAMIEERANDLINEIADKLEAFEEMILNCKNSEAIMVTIHAIYGYEKFDDVPRSIWLDLFNIINRSAKEWAQSIAEK